MKTLILLLSSLSVYAIDVPRALDLTKTNFVVNKDPSKQVYLAGTNHIMGPPGASITNIGDSVLDYYNFNSLSAQTGSSGIYGREKLIGSAAGWTNISGGISSNAAYFNGGASTIMYSVPGTAGVFDEAHFSTNFSTGGTNQFSISAWVFVGPKETANLIGFVSPTILGMWENGSALGNRYKLGYELYSGSGALTWTISDGIGNYTAVPLWPVASQMTNRWVHIAMGYDGRVPEIWFQTNAGPRTSVTSLTLPLFQSGTNTISPYKIFAVGNTVDGSCGYLGAIDEVVYWNRLITTTEVTSLYGGGTNPLVYSSATWTNRWQYKFP